jgi:Uma2 family endonuclease
MGGGLMTAEEYLAMDRAAEFRSEFLDGEIIAMSGGSMRHSGLGANIIGQLHALLLKTDSRTFTSDFRVRVTSRM